MSPRLGPLLAPAVGIDGAADGLAGAARRLGGRRHVVQAGETELVVALGVLAVGVFVARARLGRLEIRDVGAVERSAELFRLLAQGCDATGAAGAAGEETGSGKQSPAQEGAARGEDLRRHRVHFTTRILARWTGQAPRKRRVRQ